MKMMDLRHIAAIVFTYFCALNAHAQDNAVAGRVLSSATERPVAKATVRLVGTALETVTDESGRFIIAVDTAQQAVLRISGVGYEPETVQLSFPIKQPLVIFLDEGNRVLEEVVVSTGYQNIPKDRSTGSFTKIGNRLFNEQVMANILDRLEAVANGLTFDRTTSASGRLAIRGISSINGPREPLVIVDDFPYDGDISNINPNDVQDITILKDAAAASIWGARAGNGVIVITTKKGSMNTPLSIDVTANATVQNKPDLFYLKNISTPDFIDVEEFLYRNGYYDSQLDAYNKPVLSPVVELLLQMSEEQGGSGAALRAEVERLREIDVRDELLRSVYDPGLHQQYALSLSGGGQTAAWRFSTGYDRNRSVLSAVSDRLNVGVANTFRPFSPLTLSTSVYYTHRQNRAGKPGYGQIISKNGNLYPYAELFDGDGTPLPLARDYRSGFVDTVGGGRLLDWRYYPGTDHQHVHQSLRISDLLLDFGAAYRLPAGFTFNVKYKYEYQRSADRNLRDVHSYYTRDLINNYTQLGQDLIHAIPLGGILTLQSTELHSHNLRGQLDYRYARKRHELTAILGAEMRRAGTEGQGNTVYGYDGGNLTFTPVDHTRPYPMLVTGWSAFIPGGTSLDRTNAHFVSWYGNAAYTLDGRYSATISGRRDASNLFGLKTNDKWKPLWSAGLGWEITEEGFWHSRALQQLKLRVTYGFSGNIDPSQVAVTTIMYGSSSPYLLEPTARIDNFANPELRWETVRMINGGIDFAMWRGRLRGSIEYYRKDGRDLFGTYPVDITAGIGTSIRRNVASIKATGADLELYSVNTDGAIGWQSALNLSYNKDAVKDYYLASLAASRFMQGGAAVSGVEGHPIYSVYSYKWAGLDATNGNPLGYLGGGQVSDDYNALTGPEVEVGDLNHHGPALPRFFGSLGNTFSWKDLSLTVRLQYKFGHYFRRQSIDYGSLFSNWEGHADFASRWQQPGDEMFTQVPSMVYPAVNNRDAFYRFSEILVEPADHVRLQYVAVNYMLGRAIAGRLGLKNLNVQFNATDLGLIWRANKQGLDPEYASSFFSIPPASSFSLKITANL